MISSIVDADGLLVYTGNDVDTKFATVLARAGHSRVEGDTGSFKKPKWDGAAWVEGHVPDYIENRLNEYPTIEELVVALYDTDDKAAIEKRRSDVKAKYPKPE
jgi:hypothetical protein